MHGIKETKDAIGKRVLISTEAVQQGDGAWKVKQVIAHERTFDLENWEHKEVEVTAIDGSIDKAMLQASIYCAQYMESVNFDLFVPDDTDRANMLSRLN